jgi:hypothetical protein
LAHRQIDVKPKAAIDCLRPQPINEKLLVAFSYTATEPSTVVIKFQNTVFTEFTVDGPWWPKNLTALTEFDW